jgi:hypothetical protein
MPHSGAGRPDPVLQVLRSQIMPPRHVRNYCTRRDRLGNDLAFLLSLPASARNHARYFGVTPNDLRVVTDLDHNVHTVHFRIFYSPNLIYIGHFGTSTTRSSLW